MTKPKAIKPVSKSKFVNMIVYADPGVGKTRFLGTTPGKSLLLRPPVDHADSIREMSPGMEEWVMADWNDMFEARDYLRHEGDQYDWVWLDSISGFQEMGLDDLWETVIAEKPARARYGLDKQEYGINQFRLGGWVRHIVGARMFNFGMTAHLWGGKPSGLDEEAGKKMMPLITGKIGGAEAGLAIKMCGYMNVIAYLDVTDKGTRVLRFNGTDEYYAKDQFDAFPDGKLVNPTMPKLISAIDKARGTRATKRRTPRRTTKG